MFGLFNTTPRYEGQGQGQPSANSQGGIFGFLSGLLSFPGTPRYETARSEPAAPVPAAPILRPEQGEPTDPGCEPVTAQALPVQPDCRVPLPVAIVIQRSENPTT